MGRFFFSLFLALVLFLLCFECPRSVEHASHDAITYYTYGYLSGVCVVCIGGDGLINLQLAVTLLRRLSLLYYTCFIPIEMSFFDLFA